MQWTQGRFVSSRSSQADYGHVPTHHQGSPCHFARARISDLRVGRIYQAKNFWMEGTSCSQIQTSRLLILAGVDRSSLTLEMDIRIITCTVLSSWPFSQFCSQTTPSSNGRTDTPKTVSFRHCVSSMRWSLGNQDTASLLISIICNEIKCKLLVHSLLLHFLST